MTTSPSARHADARAQLRETDSFLRFSDLVSQWTESTDTEVSGLQQGASEVFTEASRLSLAPEHILIALRRHLDARSTNIRGVPAHMTEIRERRHREAVSVLLNVCFAPEYATSALD